MLVFEPVPDTLRERLPIRLVREDVLATQLVELRDAVRLDLLLARDAERFLDLDLDGQAVCVPAGDARDALLKHRVVAAHEILNGTSAIVMHPRSLVVRRLTLVKLIERQLAIVSLPVLTK